jgi:Raf kinase inhibitor-like YbhB/YbcL family protein
MKRNMILILLALFVFAASGCAKGGASKMQETIVLKSPTFENMETIPVKYTGLGEDVSIPLQWSNIPSGTKSIAILMDDPDAPIGTFTHWIIFDIPPEKTALPEGVPQELELSDGSKQGKNDFGRIGYNGPMPPPGKVHHYVITIFALDTVLNLPAGINAKAFHRAIKGHILAEGKLVGLFKR